MFKGEYKPGMNGKESWAKEWVKRAERDRKGQCLGFKRLYQSQQWKVEQGERASLHACYFALIGSNQSKTLKEEDTYPLGWSNAMRSQTKQSFASAAQVSFPTVKANKEAAIHWGALI